MIVMKFGGSSLASPDKVRTVARLVRAELLRRPIVVVSAHGKTTNQLIEAARLAASGRVDAGPVHEYHDGLVRGLGLDRRLVEPLFDELSAWLRGVSLLKELTDRTLDHIMSFGERLSTRIVAGALEAEGVAAAAVCSYDIGLLTDSRHGAALPLAGIDDRIAAEIARFSLTPVVTGFLGKTTKGDVTTLGRSGSDFSASIIGAAVGAAEVQIWTDVNGVMTCDPSLESRAENLPLLSFDEASELAYFGAEVLHPSTIVPAIRKKIPVRVLHTMRPSDPGTTIVSEPTVTSRIAKSVVYKEDVSLINLASPRLTSAVQILSAAFDRLSARGVGIHMATTSEATVSLVTDRRYDDEQLRAPLAELAELEAVTVEHDKAIVCVVGEELRGRKDVLGRIFTAISDRGIKAQLVSQSASAINVAFLVDNAEIEPAVRALHALVVG